MDWHTLPGFDEKYSRITIKEHKSLGCKTVEVLYGAQDENGNPIAPKEAGVDGCGRWYGIESNGEYTMFSWQHPACDGGQLDTLANEYSVEFNNNFTKTEWTIRKWWINYARQPLGTYQENLDFLKNWCFERDLWMTGYFKPFKGEFLIGDADGDDVDEIGDQHVVDIVAEELRRDARHVAEGDHQDEGQAHALRGAGFDVPDHRQGPGQPEADQHDRL